MASGLRVVVGVVVVVAAGCGDGAGFQGQPGGGRSDADAAVGEADGAPGAMFDGAPGGVSDAAPDQPSDAAPPDAGAPDAGTGGGEEDWGETFTLDEGAYPHVAIDPAGEVVAFWETRGAPWDSYFPTEDYIDSRVVSRHKARGEPWGPDELVGEVPLDSSYVEPGICPQGEDGTVLEQWRGTVHEYPAADHVAIDASGGALAVWNKVRERDITCPGPDPANQVTTTGMLSRFDPAGVWVPRELAIPTFVVRAAMNDAGQALVVWNDWQATNQIWAMPYEPGGGWGEPVVVHPAPGLPLQVALDGDGDGLLAWRDGMSIWAARYAGGSWSPAVVLGSSEIDDGVQAGPILAMNDDGAALAVWNRCRASEPYQTRCAIHARRFDPAAGWSPRDVVRGAGPESQLVASVDGSGGGTVAWIRGWGAEGKSIEAARLEAGSWQPPVVIAVAATSYWVETAEQITMAGDALGNVLVGWEWMRWRCSDACDEVGEHEYVVRHFEVGAGWGATVSLLLEETVPFFYDAGPVRLAMNASGQGVAVWTSWPRNAFMFPPTVQAKLFR